MIPYGKHYIDDDDIRAVTDVLKNGQLTQGPRIEEFERVVADYVGAKFAVAVSSGTAALHMAYLALGLGDNDRVAMPSNTFVATANAARYCGAEPLFVDISNETLNMDTSLLKRAVQDNNVVKAITAVHFAGLPAKMKEINELASCNSLSVIEDAAHALGACYEDGSRVGNCKYSDVTIFSFHPVKHIAAGEGGMLTTNDESVYRHLLRLRSHGINKGNDPYVYPDRTRTGDYDNAWYYEAQETGFNYRITDIQCTLAVSQMKKLDRFLARRKELAERYYRSLQGIPCLTSVYNPENHKAHALHLYVIRVDFDRAGISRAEFMYRLRGSGIGTQVHYVPVHLHPFYDEHNEKLPVTEKYYEEALSIPLYYSLSDKEQDLVISTINKILV